MCKTCENLQKVNRNLQKGVRRGLDPVAGGEPQAGFQITNLRFQIEGVVLRRFDRRQAGGRGRDWFCFSGSARLVMFVILC